MAITPETTCALDLFETYRLLHGIKKVAKELRDQSHYVRPRDGDGVLDSLTESFVDRVSAGMVLVTVGHLQCLPELDFLEEGARSMRGLTAKPGQLHKAAEDLLSRIDAKMKELGGAN